MTKSPKMYLYPENAVWRQMKQRCNNPNSQEFKNYGARGISYSKEWEDFKVFIAHMGRRPTKTHSLDRIDNDKDYSKENCRWADKRTQSLNRRKLKNTSSRFRGVSWNTKDSRWAVFININGKSTYCGYFKSEMEAAKMWDDRARELGYEESWLNFPKEKTS